MCAACPWLKNRTDARKINGLPSFHWAIRAVLVILCPCCLLFTRTIMARRCCYSLLLLGVLLLTSCQQAHRFPATAKGSGSKSDAKAEEADRFLYRYSWVEPRETR